MNTLSLRLKYRPLRIGWCLPEGDIVGLRKALRLTHTMWGGRFNPIIPIGDFDRSSSLVRDFHVDVLFPLSEEKDVQTFIKRFSYLPNPFYSQPFVNMGFGTVSTVLDLSHPIQRLYEEYFKHNLQPAFRASLYVWDDADPLADILLATFGSFPPKEDTGTDYCELIERYLAAEQTNLSIQEAIPSDAFRKVTPNRIGCLELKHYYSRDIPGFYMGNATDFHDLVCYWNLRAADIDLLFYDPSFAGRLNALRTAYLAALHGRPQRSALENHVAIWSQHDPEELARHGFGDSLPWCHWRPEIELNGHAPLLHFEEKSVLATVGQSLDKLSVSFALPEKPWFDDVSRLRHQHFVVSIVQGAELYGNERATFVTPYVPELNEYYGRNYAFHPYQVRVEPEGVGLIVDGLQEDLRLHALDVTSLLSRIFEVAGMRIQPSQPGLIAARLIQQLGGPQGCRVFKIAGVRALIEHYKPDQSFPKKAALRHIGQKKTGGPNFAEYEWLILEPQSQPSKLSADAVFTYLVKHGVFRAGLEFTCPACALDFWLLLDDVRTETRCEYCGHAFHVASQLRDRDCWRYRRSGLFGKDNHQEGSIPVVLTLQQMDTALSFQGKLYTTAMEIKPASACVRKCEIDFVMLTQKIDHVHNMDHTVQIAIGECKNSGEITEDNVTNLRMVAEALEDKGMQVFVIFSKLEEFTPEELARCQAVNSTFRKRLILFTARELEPYHLYERTAQALGIPRQSSSLEGMVAVTETVFFGKDGKQLRKIT